MLRGWVRVPAFLRGVSPRRVESTHLRGSLNTSVRAISGATAVTAASSSPLSGALTLGWNMSHDFLSYSWAIRLVSLKVLWG